MDPVPPLLARLAHPNPGIREAAVAALREIPNPPADLSKHVNRLLQDRDSAVRQQAEMTFQHLHPRPEVHLSPERMAEVMMDADAFIKRAMSRKKNRF
jgi:hypothetical protein